MRILIWIPMVVIAVSAAGCAWTPAERQEFIDKASREAAEVAVAHLQDKIVPKVKEKVGEVMTSIVEKLNVPDELKTKIRETAISAINDGIDKLFSGEIIGAKLEKTFRDALDEVLPEGDPEGGSGTARLIGGILSGLVLGGLGLKKPGG